MLIDIVEVVSKRAKNVWVTTWSNIVEKILIDALKKFNFKNWEKIGLYEESQHGGRTRTRDVCPHIFQTRRSRSASYFSMRKPISSATLHQ